MSAFIGYCFDNGAFLSSDSRRVSLVDGQVESDQIKKTRKLTDSIVVATGGLGTIGHQCMDFLQQHIGLDDNINSILAKATPIFSSHYADFASDNPAYSNTPLYAIFAGFDVSKNIGFIKVLTNKDAFQKPMEITPGKPYFTGSNTEIVMATASKIYFEHKVKYDKFKLDVWSCESMRDIAKLDSNVSLPIELMIVRKLDIVKRTWTNCTLSGSDPVFEVDYPQ